MEFVDGPTLRRLLPMPTLLDAVESAYRDVAAGRDRSPIRSQVPIPGGTLVLMPGMRDGGSGHSVKLVAVMSGNAERGLPTVQAVALWIDADTGQPRYVLDGPTLTAMRTGAASGVSARLLARPDASVLAVFGAGAQAEWQIRAVCAARPIRQVRVYARRPDALAAFVAGMDGQIEAEIRPAASAADAVRGADVICTATTSTTPVFDAEWVEPGTHVSGVGSFQHSMIELPPAVFARAMIVAVDSREAALAEAGDLVAALKEGYLADDGFMEIGGLPADWAGSRPADAITVFKSVGLAIQDLAAAEVAVGALAAS
jgi:ornithine cyclodeaminase